MTPLKLIAIDTHAHLYMVSKPAKELIAQAQAAGVMKMVVPGTTVKTSKIAAELAVEFPDSVIPVAGIHPSESISPTDIQNLDLLLATYPFKAIGEIGLDYFHKEIAPDVQKFGLIAQLELALKYQLPVIIHNREADEDVATILWDFPDIPKVFHCFSSDMRFVKKTMAPKTYFSFTGNITYKNKEKAHEVISFLPLDKIMIETDCPFLAPVPYRGKENEPAFVIEVARQISDIKNISLDDVIKQTTANAISFFNIKA